MSLGSWRAGTRELIDKMVEIDELVINKPEYDSVVSNKVRLWYVDEDFEGTMDPAFNAFVTNGMSVSNAVTSDKKLSGTLKDGGTPSYINKKLGDFTMEFDLVSNGLISSSKWQGFIMVFKGPSSAWPANSGYSIKLGGGDPNTNTIVVKDKTTTLATITDKTILSAAGTINRIKVELYGKSLKMYFNGQLYVNQTMTSTLADGFVSFLCEGASGSTTNFNNVKIYKDADYVAVDTFALGQASMESVQDETMKLLPVITPANATYNTATYVRSDPTIATVDANGVVTGVSTGRAVITVTSKDIGAVKDVYKRQG